MTLTAADLKWVDETLARLSTREKLGQIMIPRLTKNAVKGYGGVSRRFVRLTHSPSE